MIWDRNKVFGIDGKIKFIYTPKPGKEEEPIDFRIEASITGVELKGTFNLNRYDKMQPFAKAIGDAWKDHQKLKPNLMAPASEQ